MDNGSSAGSDENIMTLTVAEIEELENDPTSVSDCDDFMDSFSLECESRGIVDDSNGHDLQISSIISVDTKENCKILEDLISNIKQNSIKQNLISADPIKNIQLSNQCEVCQKVFKSKRYLKEHKILHNEVRPFKCSNCPRSFSYKRYLNAHTKTHESIKSSQRHVCQICGKSFKEKRYLNSHFKSHTTKFECPVCDTVFIQKRYLTSHLLRVHGPEKTEAERFACIYCGSSYKEKRYLSDHLKIHTNPNQFKCDVCPMVFSQKRYLTSHVKFTHSNSQRIHCDSCSKSFKLFKYYKCHKCVSSQL